MKRALLYIITLGLMVAIVALKARPQNLGASEKPLAVDKARIYGRVCDFTGKPVEGADVFLMTARFDEAAKARSAADGSYSLTVDAGMYIAMAAVKDYRIKNLEYWAWNIPAFGELEINPCFDRLEVYAINAWRPQGGYPSFQIYFRPMSLAKAEAAAMKVGGMAGLTKLPVLDIAPRLEAKDIIVKVSGETVEILRINKVKEASGPNQDMYGYLIQTVLPKAPPEGNWVVLDIRVTDPETGEKGEGRLYLAKPLQGASAR